jgi:hypothetical protein
MKNFSEKHIFFCRDMDTFINLFVDSLICKLNLNKDDLLIIVIPTKDRYPFNKALDVKYIDYKYECHADYAKAKSLSFISLNNTNSIVINEIIQTSDDVIKKLFILITDDEVDRWNKNFNENFSLDEDFNQNISKEVIKSLSYNLNFIMPQEYFYPILSKIINLEKKNIVNSSIIFDILFTNESKKLHNKVKATPKREKKILLGSKPGSFGFRASVKILNSFCKANMNKDHIFVCFNEGRHKIALMLFVVFTKVFRGLKLQIEFFERADPETYNLMISSISFFILQDRGGASTARVYAKWGCGTLCIMKGSPNANMFSKVFKINFIDFNKYSDIASMIKTNYYNEVLENQAKVIEQELESIKALSKIYS